MILYLIILENEFGKWHFGAWWQEECENPADFLEYHAGQLKTAVMLSEMVNDLVWPDFKVGAE